MGNYYATMYIVQMKEEHQKDIEEQVRNQLKQEGYEGEELGYHVQRALEGRLSDIEELVEVSKYIKK